MFIRELMWNKNLCNREMQYDENEELDALNQ